MQHLADRRNDREAFLFAALPGDQITAEIATFFGVTSATPSGFSESATYELKYVPEPSASLMLPTGIGALMMLNKVRR